MSQSDRHDASSRHDHEAPARPPVGPDVLLTRIVDHEASADDVARFELMAVADPSLWRALARSLMDARTLESEFDEAIAPALAVDVPVGEPALPPAAPRGRSRFIATAAALGWAAVVVLGVLWSISSMLEPHRGSSAVDRAIDAWAGDEPADVHLRRYLQSPHVLGELQPILLEAQGLTDGRVALRYMRRIEEVKFIEPGESFSVEEFDPAAQAIEAAPPPRSD